ncbi:MAG: NADH-quinone oxidoreductase subunit L [Epsilonproteobacteria bacterium]|nr:NADH-quinone oxidoreductase subunit L [Campylobacterota bacterium]
MEKYLYIALFAPIVGSLFAAMFGNRPKNLITGLVTSGLLFASWVASMILLMNVDGDNVVKVKLMDWIAAGTFNLDFGFVADQVSVIMMVTVTTVSTLVHIYSIGYMDHDKGFNRYFSYLSAFVFSMMVLVMSDNFLGLFIGWEGVGLCSWLLIGHWYYKKDVARDVNPAISPAWAANEAFVMNRVADLGMLIGIFMIYWNLGSLEYDTVFANIGSLSTTTITLIGIFLFIGAMGKSAQFPLHTWLANAMEGPTPVSALIHAATMVTAGVYLVVRSHEIYALIPNIGYFIACLGAFVAVFAASMALVNMEMKRIIAYSTLSQLGYMFVAAGLGAYWIALFHLMAHAFFKSVLFLGAGNVMHAMDEEKYINKMGGLSKLMPWTMGIMTVASLALAGIWPLAGFFSKDKILETAFAEHNYFLWGMLWLGAGMTAYYSFRLVMMVFFGKKNYSDDKHPHEAYPFVIAAMIPLVVLAVIAGFFEHAFMEYVTAILPEYYPHVSTGTFIFLLVITLGIAISGIALAVIKFSKGNFDDFFKKIGVHKVLSNQYFIPQFYEDKICKPYASLSEFAWKKIDMRVVDATVDFIAGMIYTAGDKSRKMQSGNLSTNLKWMVFGLVVLLILALFKIGM